VIDMAGEKLVTHTTDDDWQPDDWQPMHPQAMKELRAKAEKEKEPNVVDTDPLGYVIEIGRDLERAILRQVESEKRHRRASNMLTKAQASAVVMGKVESSLADAELGKNDFNRRHALTLLADKEQQKMLDAEDNLAEANALLKICNNRAVQVGLLR